MVEEAEALQSEIERLEVAGIHSAASFVARGRYVAILPLSVEETVVGYLAVGTTEHAVRDAPPDCAHRGGAAEHRLDPLATHGAQA